MGEKQNQATEPKTGRARNGKARLQAVPATPLPMKAAAEPPDMLDTEKVNILLVDDTPQNLVALEALLCDLNQNLVKATSGKEALRCLLKQDFAVIILDVNMPGLNGFETAALIRQRRSSEFTPIIFVSAISTSDMHTHKGYALGAVDYIFTPVVPEILRTKVTVFVELLKKTHQVKRQAEQLRQIEEREHKRVLMEAEERLGLETRRNRFFQLSIDMLAIADFNGFFRQLNPSWRSALGYSDEELKSRPWIEFVHQQDREATVREITKLKESNTPLYFENRYLCQNGGFRWLEWTAAPFREEALLYLFARDITGRKNAETEIHNLNGALEIRAKELESANEELQHEILVRQRAEEALKETNAELESFSYSVSHDLRAPLRAMQGFAEALIEDCSAELSEIGKEYASRIMAAAQRMDTLIQDLLVYSRISHNSLEPQVVNLDKAIHEAKVQLEAPIQETQAELSVQKPLPEVRAHHATLVQVISNLISNGVKFVAPGVKPRVRIHLERKEKTGRLWVEDNGIGIPPEYHVRIFRVFERLHGVEAYPGTGIGLAIVRKGTEKMGGVFGVESSGSGSKFWIELPLAEPSCVEAEEEWSGAPASSRLS